ncbi:hypothetical protein BASA83_009096 [Batrachochytrium salamandrivorans]|nr:hypothetical protein BASA83_009096 [Batrachochytrium salamandrivorans]
MQGMDSENLAKGFIRNSSSQYGRTCFFVKQKDKLRLCMDYRGLNKQTLRIEIQSRYIRNASHPLYWKDLHTLDLRGAYNLLRIKEGDEPKTAFITKYGQFEFLVMPFGLSKRSGPVPANDELVVSSYDQPEKMPFLSDEIKYLGYIISPNGTCHGPIKDFCCSRLAGSKKVRELQVFLGFTNFYRALVSGYSDITCHFTKLLKKDVPFSWGPEQEASFKRIFYVDQELTRRQARWSLELSEYTFTITHRPGKLNGRADSLSRREDYFLDGDQSNFQRVIDPDNVLDLQVAMADLDLHVLVHSTVLDKVFVQEADWPLIIADFLAGEDNVWIEEISEDWLELCKKELKNFRFRDNTFVRILNDGKSTATYMPSNDRVQVMNITMNP